MTTKEAIERAEQGIRARGIAYLTDLAATRPSEFLQLVAWVADEAERAGKPEPPTGPVHFVITQQPNSNNRT